MPKSAVSPVVRAANERSAQRSVRARAAAATVARARARGIPAWVVGEVVHAASIGGRYLEEEGAR